MYAASWWQRQKPVTFENNLSSDVPPFGVVLYRALAPITYHRELLANAVPVVPERFIAFSGTPDGGTTGILFNGPTTARSLKYGVGSLCFPAITRVRKDYELRPGIGLGYGAVPSVFSNAQSWELDEGTLFEVVGVFEDSLPDAQLALVMPRRKVTAVGPTITFLFDAGVSGTVLPFSDAGVTHEQYSDTPVSTTDVNDGRFVIDDSDGQDALVIPLDGIYAFSHSVVSDITASNPQISFIAELPSGSLLTNVVTLGMRFANTTDELSASQGTIIRPCLAGMRIKITGLGSDVRGFTLSVSRVAPLPSQWYSEFPSVDQLIENWNPIS